MSQFRVTEERSQAIRADGVSLELLVIDHIQRRVSCYPPDADPSAGRHIELPADDRVVNVTRRHGRKVLFASLLLGFLLAPLTLMAINKPHNFARGTEVRASEVNANFDALFRSVTQLQAGVASA